MKRTLTAILATAMLAALLCGQALAEVGDITVEDAKAYSDAAMTECVGTIPAYTALVVRSYGPCAQIAVKGKALYIDAAKLLTKDAPAKYSAILKKGTRIYRRAATAADSYTLKSAGTVKICKVSGDWALVQSTGNKGLYAFVKVSKLTRIRMD